jgi:hypothetical protein
MPPLPCAFSDIRSRKQLADKLNVDIKSLDLVTLTDTTCKSDGCNLPTAKNNYDHCILCSQRWYPRKFSENGSINKYRRGYGLYGPQFMRQYNGTEQKKVCACDMEECQKIGYSHSGMLCFPTDATDVEVAIRALGIQCPTTKANIVRDPRSHRIAPWHYHRNHLQKNANGNWSIRTMQKYTDSDRKVFNFAPPNGNIKQFIESDILPMGHSVCRGGVDVPPSWVKELAALQASNQQQCHASTPNPSNNKMRRVAHPISTPTTTPRPARKRPSPDKAEIEELTAKAALLEVQLNSALNHSYNLEAKVKVLDGENLQLRLENTKLKKENAELRGKVEELEGKKCVISYDDLKPGGMLADYVNSFTFFPTFETNDLFLEIINGDIGVCERIKRYHHVTVEERVKYNNEIRAKMEEEKKNNEAGGNGGGEAGEDLDVIMAEASLEGDADNLDEVMAEANINGTQRTRKRTLHWKTEYLVYCFFTRCNISMTRIAALFGVGRILVHDIVYGWANMLADTLAQFFPVPTRSQMLRAYPKSVIKKFGHAHIFMLLDAIEIFAEVASMKSVNAILYSAYKHHSTLKWLVGCDPIGTVWNDSISEGYPGAISDPIQTIVTNILEQIPFGCAVEVDKGFLIENECAFLGIHCVRPMKMLTGQMQQSKEDVALTQKVGKTRIPVEQVNGQMKNSASFFDKRIRLDQIGLADLICRVSYLLQNFKLGFIQQHDGTKKDRPCKAHIRWYDGEDDGLIDIRPYVEMWGTTSEINRWRELADMPENKDATNLEISEMVLAEDWPTRLRKEHLERLA